MNSNKVKVSLFSLIVFLTTPFTVFALTFRNVANRFIDIFSMLVPILISLGVIGFLYGTVRYLFSAGNPEARADGAKYMVYGIVALFVMVSVWGLVAVLQNTIFGSSTFLFNGLPQIP